MTHGAMKESRKQRERHLSLCEILIPTTSLSDEATNVDKNYSLDEIPFLGVAYTPKMRKCEFQSFFLFLFFFSVYILQGWPDS